MLTDAAHGNFYIACRKVSEEDLHLIRIPIELRVEADAESGADEYQELLESCLRACLAWANRHEVTLSILNDDGTVNYLAFPPPEEDDYDD